MDFFGFGYLFFAIALIAILVTRAYLAKYKNINMDNIDVVKLWNYWVKRNSNLIRTIKYIGKNVKPCKVITKNTGFRSIIMSSAGSNKATVMATLRQITGMDYDSAKNVVEYTPSLFMAKISDREAVLNKKALEFVGAKIDIL